MSRYRFDRLLLVLTVSVGCVFFLCGCDDRGDPVDSPSSANETSHGIDTSTSKTDTSKTAASRDSSQDAVTGSLPAFVDVAEDAGLAFQRDDDIGKWHRILESNGGGVAAFDYDADGWTDLFFTNGRTLPRSEPGDDPPDGLFRNVRGNRFAEVGRHAGVTIRGYHYGCTVGDWNSDGFDDLYVTALGRNLFYVNQGDGTFRERGTEFGIEVGLLWSSSAAFADLNRDGLLDLYVANYVQTSDDPPRLCENPSAPDGYITCPPTIFAGEPDRCFLTEADAQFVDRTTELGLTGDDPKGLGVAIFDIDQDSDLDIYVANDGVANHLYVNPGLTGDAWKPFESAALLRGVALSGAGRGEASMGIAVADADRNGWNDLFLTHFYAETNTYYRAEAGGYYRDETNAAGLAIPSRQYLGFGTVFVDYDNDLWPDLFVANGHVDDMRWKVDGLEYKMPPQMFRNQSGNFVDVSKQAGDYFHQKWLGRGVASGDFDRDGRIDLAVSHQLAPSSLLMNRTETSHPAIVLQLIGTGTSNRSAIGATIRVERTEPPVFRELIGGGSYQSAPEKLIHVGLADLVQPVTLEIVWPSGERNALTSLSAGRYTVVQGIGAFSMFDARENSTSESP